ncbi:type II toxin-antitoxin system VapC family toxin [Methylomonas rivi]|uniref:PIN domain-containing protein n=1 Tax=Methylomonas rivi TaxID=2952226 RepID=A0ABT1UA52_9GAMM|nr:PIN domain-containing protein [Methylomonas sp. WSC-6]MCQ8130740.1 PIN domain-containing protein [Methylomonas sp. WSC-6]
MIIADSGFWIALADKNDKHHIKADAAAKSLDEGLITTFPVMTEVCHILLKRRGAAAQLSFMQMYQLGAFEVFEIQDGHKARIVDLMRQYADLPMDLADASLVLLAEDLGHGRIFSTDQRDFHAYRWKSTRPFLNLLLP